MNQWKEIKSEQDIALIKEASVLKPQIIFKDSTTCGISAYAKERLTNGQALWQDTADFNYLDLLTYRNISNFIASDLEVVHQSPQIIVLKNKEVVYTRTHHSIQAEELAEVVAN